MKLVDLLTALKTLATCWREPGQHSALKLGYRLDSPGLESEYRGKTFFGAFAKSRKATISFAISVCPSTWNNSANTDRFS